MMTGKYKVLIVTSRWSIDGKDMDGGCLTALNICEALSDASTIDVLLPRFYDGMSSDIVNKTMFYDIEEEQWENLYGPSRFEMRMKVSTSIAKAVLACIDNYEKIIVIHAFHAFGLCEMLTEKQLQKVVLFPMFLSESYNISKENVPVSYTLQEINTLRKVGKIITPSTFEKNIILKADRVNPNKIDVVPRYVGMEFKPRIIRNISTDIIQLCYVGSIKKQKQNHLVVNLAKELINRGINPKIHLVGPVHDEAEWLNLRELISEENLDSNICYHGVMSQKDLCTLLNRMHFIISISLCETFGRSVIEGLFLGLPAVVLNNAICFREIMGLENGVTFANDIEDMAKSLCSMWLDEQLYQLKSEQALKFSEKFAADKIVPLLKKSLIC